MFFIYGVLTTYLFNMLIFSLIGIIGIEANIFILTLLFIIITAPIEFIMFSGLLKITRKRAKKVKISLIISCVITAMLIFLKLDYNRRISTWGAFDFSTGFFVFFTVPCLIVKNIIDFQLLNKNKTNKL